MIVVKYWTSLEKNNGSLEINLDRFLLFLWIARDLQGLCPHNASFLCYFYEAHQEMFYLNLLKIFILFRNDLKEIWNIQGFSICCIYSQNKEM